MTDTPRKDGPRTEALLREFAALKVGIDEEIAVASDNPDAFEQGSLAAYDYVLSHWPEAADTPRKDGPRTEAGRRLLAQDEGRVPEVEMVPARELILAIEAEAVAGPRDAGLTVEALASALYETDPPESWMRTGTDEYRKRATTMRDILASSDGSGEPYQDDIIQAATGGPDFTVKEWPEDEADWVAIGEAMADAGRRATGLNRRATPTRLSSSIDDDSTQAPREETE